MSMSSSVAARGIFQGNIDLTYNVDQIPGTIRPESDIVRVNLFINHFVSGLGSKFVIPFFSQNTVPIEVTIGDHPEWLTVSAAPGVVYPKLGLVKAETPETVIISISLTPNAPAFQTESFEIIARHPDTPPISTAVNKIPIEIKSGYYSNYQYDYDPFKEMGAAETVTFPIDITGFSNARSLIRFRVLNPPDGWVASIPSEYFLGTAALDEDATGRVSFTIQSPLDFGYYNEVQQFQLEVTTSAAGHPEAGVDNRTVLQFTVQARGFSTPGFEAAFTVIALIATLVIYKKKFKK